MAGARRPRNLRDEVTSGGSSMQTLGPAAIAIFVLIEKVAPLGTHAGRVGGGLLAAAGLAVMIWG